MKRPFGFPRGVSESCLTGNEQSPWSVEKRVSLYLFERERRERGEDLSRDVVRDNCCTVKDKLSRTNEEITLSTDSKKT